VTRSKRAFDLVVAGLAALILAVPFGVILILQAVVMGRPIFYASERMRSEQDAFVLWKLRSMRPDVANQQGVSGGDKVDRIPPWGRFLRASRLDEVPQLWNILRGDMTLVGPRPPLRMYVDRFPQHYAQVLRARPGLTGLATLVLHRWETRLLANCRTAGQTDAVYARRCIPRKAHIDALYQRHACLRLDVAILFWTVQSLLSGRKGRPRRQISTLVTRGRQTPTFRHSADRAIRTSPSGIATWTGRISVKRIAAAVQALRDRQKRAILASADGVLGGAIYLCLHPDQVWTGPGLELLTVAAMSLGILSAGTGLNGAKLNAFLRNGVPRCVIVAMAYGGILAVTQNMSGHPVSAHFAALTSLLAFGGIVLSRALTLQLLLWLLRNRQQPVRVLVYGAGETGQQLVDALRTHETIVPTAFVDDNPVLHGSTVAGLKVHPTSSLADLARQLRVDRVLLAMPSQPASKLMRLTWRIHAAGLDAHALPSFAQLAGAEPLCDQLSPITPDMVLGRTELAWDLDSRADAYRGRSVMVTGAGGSVGSALCHQILTLGPARLILFEMSELALYTIHRALTALPQAIDVQIVPVLGSAADPRLVRSTLQHHDVQIVFHAAAYKHVPLVEANPIAGLANNVLGTRVLAQAALDAQVERFILISSDKAVRPTNVMGASKRLAELVVQDLAKRSMDTEFAVVRFGNVMGSSGSVIPLFRDQIAAGGPITLTHEDVTRYFMTLSEAAQLVLFAGSLDDARRQGDGVFVLDMGDPVRIRDLAAQMVSAAGLTVRDAAHPEGDIEIRVTGLRPGEKLHEELLISQGMVTTLHPKILRAAEPSLQPLELAGILQALQQAIAAGDADLARLVVLAATRPHDERSVVPLHAPHRSVGAQRSALPVAG
jgi:FlaA1/EpsC-like NDP-sugar epimerase/lipopolysaccharide/colanic/teichoic acid biosynthesis glycosyltransferase